MGAGPVPTISAARRQAFLQQLRVSHLAQTIHLQVNGYVFGCYIWREQSGEFERFTTAQLRAEYGPGWSDCQRIRPVFRVMATVDSVGDLVTASLERTDPGAMR